MGVELPYDAPPQWQVTRPSEHDRLNGAPPLVVLITGKTPADIEDAFTSMQAIMGWKP